MSQQYLEQVLQIRLGTGNPALVAPSYNNLGRLARLTGDEVGGRRYFEQALPYLRKKPNFFNLAVIFHNLTNLSLEMGDLKAAERYAEEGLEHANELENKSASILAFTSLGEVSFEKKDYPASIESYRQGLTICRVVDDRVNTAIILNEIARCLIQMNCLAEARQNLAESRRLYQAIGSKEGLLQIQLTRANLIFKGG